MSKHHEPSPIEVAFISMADRIDRLACVMRDPYIKITDTQRTAIKQACEAIEEEWLLDPSMRAPRNKG